MAKGDSEFAVAGPECQEVAGEHRRAVARPHRGRSPGTGDPDQAASMGVGPKTWARGEPDAWERARPVRRCGPGKRTLRKKHTAPRPDPYLTVAGPPERGSVRLDPRCEVARDPWRCTATHAGSRRQMRRSVCGNGRRDDVVLSRRSVS